MREDVPIERQFKSIFELYENDMQEWDAGIYLNELEMLYTIRERINRIIIKMKQDISRALVGV